MEFNNMPYSTGLGTAPALANVDLSDEVPISYNPNDVSNEAERYLIWVGSTITQSQIIERPDLRTGGEYFGSAYKTLVRSRGLLRRCQITPMEPAFDFMSTDMIGDDARLHAVTSQSYSPIDVVHGVQVYPGDEINGLLGVQRQKENAKGILEIEQLRGIKYGEFKASGLQNYIFPNWEKIMAGVDELPGKLSALRAHLEGRKADTSDAAIKDVINVYLQSCDQFYRWGQNYLKMASTLVKMPATGGFVHTYSELAEQLFDWLEIRREDMLSKDSDLADIIARAQSGNNVSNGEITGLLAKMTEVMATLAQNQAPSPIADVPVTDPIEVVVHERVEGVLYVGDPVWLEGEAGIIQEVKTAGWYVVETPSGTKTVRKDKLNATAG